MKNKIVSILVCMLLIATSIVILPNKNNVQAEEPGEEDGPINGLDYEYLWSQINEVANVIRKYPPGTIPKGRFMGSIGGNDTCNRIIMDQMTNMGLSNVRTDKIEQIGDSEIYYNSLLDVVGYNLTVNYNGSSDDIPKSEVFPSPSTVKKGCCNYEYTNEFEETIIIHQNFRKHIPDSWFDSDYVVSDYYIYNEGYDEFIGKLEYITEEDQAPDPIDQQGRVYLFDWDSDTQDIIDNLTSAAGVVLVDTGESLPTLSLSKNCYHVKMVNESAGDDLKDILESNSDVLIDAIFENITVYYELNTSWVPDSDFVVIDRIPDHFELKNDTTSFLLYRKWKNDASDPPFPNLKHYIQCYLVWSAALRAWNLLRPLLPDCIGIILYSSFDHHIMLPTHLKWDFENPSEDEYYGNYKNAYPMPTFCVNETLGEFLNDTKDDDPPTTISGDIHQEYFEGTEEDPGVDADNVIGELNSDESSSDKFIIISNRYDGMWGETPSDSGIGTAMVLALARHQKYLQQNYSVDPKYNITYLFTTGEEMGFRGAYYQRDKFIDDGVADDIKMWIGFDQLGQDQSDLVSSPDLRSPNEGNNASIYRDIIWAIANITDYEDRSGYSFIPEVKTKRAGSEDYVWAESVCDTIVFKKDNARIWDRWHATGDNYTNGDSLNYTDSNDVNCTYDMAWHFVKYFCYDPDCWFTNATFEAFDSLNDGDTLPDSIRANFTINTTIPHDLTRVEIWLSIYGDGIGGTGVEDTLDYIVTSSGLQESYTFTIPDNVAKGNYSLKLKLYNSTGRINEIVGIGFNNYNDTSGESDIFQLYHPFGCTKLGDSCQTVADRITGSVFTINEYGIADNITRVHPTYESITFPPGTPKTKCIIFRANDSKVIGTTEEKTGSASIYNFSDPKPKLIKNTEYILTFWGNNSNAKIYYDDIEDEHGRYLNLTYNSSIWPDPLVFTNESRTYSIYCSYTPTAPEKPTLWGPLTITEGITYTYNASTIDPDENASLYYQFDWGDDSELSDWIGPFASGATCNNATHTWTEQGYYDIKVRAKDESGDISVWSDPLSIVAPFDDDPEPQIGISPSIHNIEDFQLEEISIGELNIGEDVIKSVTDVIDDAQYYYGAKIKNIGSTDIIGGLWTQIQFFEETTGQWITLNDPVNDTTPKTINSGRHLALGPIFKGRVHTKALTNGNGNYRVYAVFGDSDGNVLKCDDDTYLVVKCEFTVTSSTG